MLPHSGVSTPTSRATSLLPVDIRRFSWVRRLVIDYVYDFDSLSEFYAGNPADPAAWRTAISRTQQHPRQRDAVADLLQAQQRDRGAPPDAVTATNLLRDPRSVAVVTGQQAGAFGGPLFTLLKALTAIKLARRAALEHQVDVVPVFWVHAEDHDWQEVASCTVLDGAFQPATVTVAPPPAAAPSVGLPSLPAPSAGLVSVSLLSPPPRRCACASDPHATAATHIEKHSIRV